MMALLIKWRAEDKERSMKWRAEDQERQLKYDNLHQTLPQMTMKSDLDHKTHKPSGNFVEQMVCDPPDKALDGDRFGFADVDSQVHNTFTPKRFEDLKLNGGIRFKRIRIKQNYHRSRFKNLESKSPRRTLDLKASLDLMGLAASQRRCVGVTTIGMKKQYNREKQSLLLAQACKSLGMFGESSGGRDTKNELQIRLGARLIVDTGVKRETHLFRYGFTSLAPMDEDGHVATWIGDQSIFTEEVKALESDDPDALMKSLQDEVLLEPKSESSSKYKKKGKLHQSGQHCFHKVQLKRVSHRRGKLKARKKESHDNGSVPLTRVSIRISKGVELQGTMRGRQFRNIESYGIQKKYKVKKVSRCSVAYLNNGVNYSEESIKVRKLVAWDPGVTGLEKSQEEGLRRWKKGLKITKLCMRHRFKSYRFSRSVKMRIWRLVKTSRRNQLFEFYLANQGWECG
ncbi:unnamed protein product, partial [Brassica oleracea]